MPALPSLLELAHPNAERVLAVAGLGLTGALIGSAIPRERKLLGALAGFAVGAVLPVLVATFVARSAEPAPEDSSDT